jgi:putative transposase
MNNRHHRRSIRLSGNDYTQDGVYAVTICTHARVHLFGAMVVEEIVLSDFGRIVEEEWLRTPVLRSNVQLDAFVIMPNHMHGIIVIADANVGAQRAAPYRPKSTPQTFIANHDTAKRRNLQQRRVGIVRRSGSCLQIRRHQTHQRNPCNTQYPSLAA